MKGKRMSALATASLMAMTALAAMPQPAMADEEKTVINIWSKDRHDADYVQKKVDEYNATNTDNIEVNYQLYTDNYQQAIDMAVQSGELPDILVFQDDAFNKYLAKDSGQICMNLWMTTRRNILKMSFMMAIMSWMENCILFRRLEQPAVYSTIQKFLREWESRTRQRHLRKWWKMQN